ncbi:unnamed protein product [Moneuplotes crassus]|uniref:Uncharacterized protein n=1 Tax=Euplotes crassus TaxID=5936 RepID=A0AAD2D1Y9_EUPCR|nr:unnamed protein product [Moneuplotes crassus]
MTEELKDGHPKHFIILVRHGERTDDPEREVQLDTDEPEVKYDCHLTDKGKNQAFQTGEFIKESIIGQNRLKIFPSDIKVFTSPFLRCIQTAHNVIKGLDYKIPDITIDDRLGEFLMKSWFDGIEKPLAHLTIDHMKHSYFQKKYLGEEKMLGFTRYYGKDATPTSEDLVAEEDEQESFNKMESNSEIKYPETYSDMYYRYSGFFNHIIYQEFFENTEEVENRSKIIILVSHGFSFDPFINCFSPDHENIVSVDYCATAVSEKMSNEDRFDIIVKGDATHCGLKPAVF